MVKTVEYRLRTLDKSILKGIIGEHLARSFIRSKLAPDLIEKEGWHHIVLSRNDYKMHSNARNKRLFSFDSFKTDFIRQGFYATKKLLARYAEVVGILTQQHCTPDGLLMKLRETGATKKLRERTVPLGARLRLDELHRHRNHLEFPVVDGELEVVEIKCGRQARLDGKQKETYNTLIAKSVFLRMIKVRIVSFDLNRFLVEEHRYERFV
jgi:hypothetical protein